MALTFKPTRRAPASAPPVLGLRFGAGEIVEATAAGLITPAELGQALRRLNTGVLASAKSTVRPTLERALAIATPEAAVCRARHLLREEPHALRQAALDGRLSMKRIRAAQQILAPYDGAEVDRWRLALNGAANARVFASSLWVVRRDFDWNAPVMYSSRRFGRPR
ncbi:MAG: hypothetical protein ACKVPX_06735 [Myxococcaceae bacterium]